MLGSMVPAANLAAFMLAALVLIAIPGPSVLFVISRGVVLGRRAALATVRGNCAGVYVQVIAVALGVGVLVERSAALYRDDQARGRRLPRLARDPDLPSRAARSPRRSVGRSRRRAAGGSSARGSSSG